MIYFNEFTGQPITGACQICQASPAIRAEKEERFSGAGRRWINVCKACWLLTWPFAGLGEQVGTQIRVRDLFNGGDFALDRQGWRRTDGRYASHEWLKDRAAAFQIDVTFRPEPGSIPIVCDLLPPTGPIIDLGVKVKAKRK